MSLRKVQSAALLQEDSKYMKPSYRQKGSESRGALYKGATSNAFTKKTIGSIPSKFETVLYPQNASMKKGFGSNSYRFGVNISENPGPGAYIDPTRTSQTCFRQISDSYSRKGYGNGFVQGCDRFKIDNYYPFQVPGPGSYKFWQSASRTEQPVGSAFGEGSVSEKYKQRASSVFAERVGHRRIPKLQPAIQVGPGAYNIPRTLLSQQDYKNTSSFKSLERQSSLGKKVLQPGPGQYETDMEGIKREIVKESAVTANDGIHTANFKQPTGSKRVKVNLYDPFENVEGEEKKTPGPGHYTAEHFTIYQKSAEKVTKGASSMFAQHDILDRFGYPKIEVKNALGRQFPGPGQYFTGGPLRQLGDPSNAAKAVSSPFKSGAKRITYLDRRPGPGPAFYKLRSDPIKDTKNINPTREWI